MIRQEIGEEHQNQKMEHSLVLESRLHDTNSTLHSRDDKFFWSGCVEVDSDGVVDSGTLSSD
jgi:hypothetical protein